MSATLPPPLPGQLTTVSQRPAEEFAPVNFEAFHGRVVESFEGKIPIVRGGGLTLRGYGKFMGQNGS